MLIIEVDPFDLQPAQGRLASRTHIVGLSIDTDKRAIRPPNIAKLGSEHNLVAAILNGFSNQLLVPTHSIDISSVEKRDAKLDGAVDGGDRLDFIAVSIKIAHAHAAEPERWHE
jgi:hypothetical protein